MGKKAMLAALLSVSEAACSPYLHSPPARMMPLETAQALPKGDIAVQGAFGGGAGIWAPGIGAGTLQARYGFGHGFEGSVEGGFAVIVPRDTEWTTTARRTVLSARTGFKYAPTSWFGVQAGFGGGGSAAGGYISPDVGIIFSYQGNVVPFLGGGFYSSYPINGKPIVFEGDGRTEVLLPDKTLGAYGNFGIRIPFLGSKNDGPRTAIMLAYRFVFTSHHEYIGSDLYQERWNDLYHLGVVSFDFVLRKREPKPREKRGRYKIH